jgi:hypothetical protein
MTCSKKYTGVLVILVLIFGIIGICFFLTTNLVSDSDREINYENMAFDVAFVIVLNNLALYAPEQDKYQVVLIAFNDGSILCKYGLLELLEKQVDYKSLNISRLFNENSFETFRTDDYGLFWVSPEAVLQCKHELISLIRLNEVFLGQHSGYGVDCHFYRFYAFGKTGIYSCINSRLFDSSDMDISDMCFNACSSDVNEIETSSILHDEEICLHRHGMLVLFWPVLCKLIESVPREKMLLVTIETIKEPRRTISTFADGFVIGKEGHVYALKKNKKIFKRNMFFVNEYYPCPGVSLSTGCP